MTYRQALEEIIQAHFLLQTPADAYYAEATIQHKIGIELFKRFGVESILERKIPGRNEYIDIFTTYEGVRYGVELKYKTKKPAQAGFEHRNHGAQNNGRYDYVWDIKRLERARGNHPVPVIDVGYAIIITNDPSYWATCRAQSGVAPFSLHDGRILQGKLNPRWKDRSEQIDLAGAHTIQWSPLPPSGTAERFRYCIVECAMSVDQANGEQVVRESHEALRGSAGGRGKARWVKLRFERHTYDSFRNPPGRAVACEAVMNPAGAVSVQKGQESYLLPQGAVSLKPVTGLDAGQQAMLRDLLEEIEQDAKGAVRQLEGSGANQHFAHANPVSVTMDVAADDTFANPRRVLEWNGDAMVIGDGLLGRIANAFGC